MTGDRAQLPVRSPWFVAEPVEALVSGDAGRGITWIREPGVHPFLRANIWHVAGRDRDLLVDSGMGISSLREAFPDLITERTVLFVTHGHLDHAGGAHEFPERYCHADDVGMLVEPDDETLVTAELDDDFASALAADSPDEDPPPYLVDSVPDAAYDVRGYAVTPAPPSHTLEDGEFLELGDRSFEVIHLPGHTPGSTVLFEQATGVLFTGDVLYEGELLDELPESDIDAYVASMSRLLDLDVSIALPGHEDPLTPEDVQRLGTGYLTKRARRSPR
jgi:glyoxylase-like metal-dependent hydrolase (beta-lactamase superfamily II)